MPFHYVFKLTDMTTKDKMIDQVAKATKEGKTVFLSFGRNYGKRYFVNKVNQKLGK